MPSGTHRSLVINAVVPLKPFGADQRFETVSGDPAKAGTPYVIRIRSERGYIIMAGVDPEKADSYALDLEQVVRSLRFTDGMGE